jgi:hypothetical protein
VIGRWRALSRAGWGRTSSRTTFDFSLLSIAYQQPTVFPNLQTPGRAAADNYIVTHTNPKLCDPSQQDCSTATVEQQYWTNDNIGNWESDGKQYVTSVTCPAAGGTSQTGHPVHER